MLAKYSDPIGTFEDDAFQLSLRERDADATQLRLQLFEVLGYPRVPLLGTYSEDYRVALPLVLIELRHDRAMLPESLVHAMSSANVDDAKNSVRVYFQVHPFIEPNTCQHFTCDSMLEFNVMFHSVLFPGFGTGGDGGDAQQAFVQVGLFDTYGLMETHQNARDRAGSGIALGRLERREVSLHYNAFSPANNQCLRDLAFDCLSFWSCVVAATETVVSFHAVCGSPQIEAQLRDVLKQCRTPQQLCKSLQSIGMQKAADVLTSQLPKN